MEISKKYMLLLRIVLTTLCFKTHGIFNVLCMASFRL